RLSGLQIKMNVEQLGYKGKELIAIVTSRWTGAFLAPDGKTRTLRAEGTGRDTWVRTPQGWRIRLAQSLVEKSWLDGALVQSRAAPSMPAGQQAAIVKELRAAAI